MRARILVIHDEHRRRVQLRDCLEPTHEVTLTDSIANAIKALTVGDTSSPAGAPFDLILSAVHLDSNDDLSAFDLLRWVRDSRLLGEVPFVLLDLEPSFTAKYVIDAIRCASSSLRASTYLLVENFNPSSFIAELDKYLPLELRSSSDAR